MEKKEWNESDDDNDDDDKKSRYCVIVDEEDRVKKEKREKIIIINYTAQQKRGTQKSFHLIVRLVIKIKSILWIYLIALISKAT